jgi:hypothetical protein
LNWSSWIRQTHRWVAIVFTVTVIANFIALPYTAKWRNAKKKELQAA